MFSKSKLAILIVFLVLIFAGHVLAGVSTIEKINSEVNKTSPDRIHEFHRQMISSFSELYNIENDERVAAVMLYFQSHKEIRVFDAKKPIHKNIDLSQVKPAFTIGTVIFLEKGYVDHLTDAELSAVIAHELAHDVNDAFRLFLAKKFKTDEREAIEDYLEHTANVQAVVFLKNHPKLCTPNDLPKAMLKTAVWRGWDPGSAALRKIIKSIEDLI